MRQGPKPSIVIGFTGADLERVPAALEAKGVTVGPLLEHAGGKHYYVNDPDGNVIMIADS